MGSEMCTRDSSGREFASPQNYNRVCKRLHYDGRIRDAGFVPSSMGGGMNEFKPDPQYPQ